MRLPVPSRKEIDFSTMTGYNESTNFFRPERWGKHMRTFTIIGGVNGVGKSSFVGSIKQYADLGVIINPDEIISDLSLSPLAGSRYVVQLGNDYLEKGISFTQESTLSGYRIKDMARRAKANGFHVRLFYIGLDSPEESVSRIANRVRKGGHNIDTEKVYYRYDRRFSDLAAILPLCDEADFYDNENGFQFVGCYENGTLAVSKKNPPSWIAQLENYLKESRING